jgi:hypothetical protein
MSLSIKSLTDYSQLENVNELVIPSSIIDYDNISFVFTTIGESSFKGTNLRSIILGEAVEVIEVKVDGRAIVVNPLQFDR